MTPPEPSSSPADVPAPAAPWSRAGTSAARIADRLGGGFDVAVVLGSGWAAAADPLGVAAMSMADAGFPVTAVAGHAGTILAGEVDGARILVLAGRVHLYEGHDPHAVVHGVRTAARLGCRAVLLTNAAGGIRPDLAVGDLVAVTDHLNLTGATPLGGTHDLPHERFVDVTRLYRASPRVAEAAGLATGVYAALRGPSYETPAEIRMLATLGADLVGMSTALEALAAHALDLEVGALSLVTNAAAGIGGELSHAEVTRTGAARGDAVVDAVVAGCRALVGGPAPSPPPTVAHTTVAPAAVAPAVVSDVDRTRRRLALAARIDHTLLAPGASAADVEHLCAEASEWRVAAVCVSPTRVAQVAERAQGEVWRPCAVVGFPSGAHRPAVKEDEARRAVADGATELDMVVNLGAVADGAWSLVAEEVSLVRRAIPAGTLKVILEAAALDAAQLEAAARAALDAGADFLKTSTGFHPAGGATVEAVAALAGLADGRAQVKAAGGIRDTDTALALLAAGADRLGCSATGAVLDGLR